MPVLRIATRKSRLALWQAEHVRDRLLQAHRDLQVEFVAISTQGDRTLNVPLATFGGKGLFLKELEQALLDGHADVAVHSMKDVTVNLPDGLDIAVVLKRGNPNDALVSNRYAELNAMPAGARLGTCSLRRKCLVRERFPLLEVIDLRGNVNTRLARLDEGKFDAIILAAAGLERLGFPKRIRAQLDNEVFLPAVGQGVIGIECRTDDTHSIELLRPLHDVQTATELAAERATNAALQGGCNLPLAVFAELGHDRLDVRGMVGLPDGSRVLRESLSGTAADAAALGTELASRLIARGADLILRAVYAG